MNNLEKLEDRFRELAGKPKTKDEIEETLILAKKIELERAKEYIDLILELREKDITISSIWDLVNTKKTYPDAIPILIKYLPKKYHDKTKEGIIRALSVKEAIGKAGPALISEYFKTPEDKANLRWVIGNAVNAVATKNEIENILDIVQNKKNGVSRQMFVATLGKIKTKGAEDILIELLDDEEVACSAIEALGRLKSQKAKEKISFLSRHSNPLIKKEALKTLKKIK